MRSQFKQTSGLYNQVDKLTAKVHLLLLAPRLMVNHGLLVHRMDDCIAAEVAVTGTLVNVITDTLEPMRFLLFKERELELVFQHTSNTHSTLGKCLVLTDTING